MAIQLSEFLATATTDELLDTYFKMDAEIKLATEREKKAKAIKKAIAKRLGTKELNDDPDRSVKLAKGTIFKQQHTSVSRENPDAFRAFLFDSDEWELANIQPYKKEVLDYVKKHGTIPDGLNVIRWYETHVHRPAASKTNRYIGD